MIYHVQFPALGLEFTVNRVAFSIFGLNIYWYGVIITLGIVLCVMLGLKLGNYYKLNEDDFIDVIMVSAFLGIVCARVYYVIFAPFKYESLLDMINIRDGGLAIYGGIIGGFLFGYLACKWKKFDFLTVADIAATCFPLGQAIGRWGNFVNQEAFGTNTTSIFGMISEGTTGYLQSVSGKLASQGIIVDPSMPVHPTFLYESVWCIIGFVLLLLHIKKKNFKGENLCLYVFWYGLGRFFIEGLRTDSLETFGGLRMSQLVALISVVVSLGILIYMNIKIKKEKSKN